jgi:hypothetical protein
VVSESPIARIVIAAVGGVDTEGVADSSPLPDEHAGSANMTVEAIRQTRNGAMTHP